ncbi:MAG TPA: hypothetical protein VGJ05_01190 [Fimbriiglobus sp.]
MRGAFVSFLIVLLVAAQPARRDEPRPVHVRVLVIAASTTNNKTDKRLEKFAKVFQKTDPTLVGFEVLAELDKRVKIGDTGTFALTGTDKLKVKVDRARDAKDNTMGLTVYPPGSGEISYSCTTGKYVPFVTEVTTKTGEKVLVAVMARPSENRHRK